MADPTSDIRQATIGLLENSPVGIYGRAMYEIGKRTMQPVEQWWAARQAKQAPKKPQPRKRRAARRR